MKETNLTEEIVRRHLQKYSPYYRNVSWVKWYAKVAPLKGKRTTKILLNYKGSNAKLLDLGCGIGLTLAVLTKTFRNSVGCDIEQKEVRATRELLKTTGKKIPVIIYDGKRLPFKGASFDIVTSIEVYEHVDKPDTMLKEIKRVLKPDGILLISTANKLWPIEPHYKLPFLTYLPKKIAEFYLKIFKRGETYNDINLPTYKEFYSQINKYFRIENITLEIIADYKKYGFDKERGSLLIVIGKILNELDHVSQEKLHSLYLELKS